ncbi:hypothetical protein BU16DRAFT_543571 [Lophium mytilinum]|uniref:Uncharacterized protein n=1 Tax=Lophium mytilinum TaxID=390894 RepID=A0A6A6QF31_9PEZI|nr:hypothetical protein BU16DRAFT_543571 [Lophium mytilinum]
MSIPQEFKRSIEGLFSDLKSFLCNTGPIPTSSRELTVAVDKMPSFPLSPTSQPYSPTPRLAGSARVVTTSGFSSPTTSDPEPATPATFIMPTDVPKTPPQRDSRGSIQSTPPRMRGAMTLGTAVPVTDTEDRSSSGHQTQAIGNRTTLTRYINNRTLPFDGFSRRSRMRNPTLVVTEAQPDPTILADSPPTHLRHHSETLRVLESRDLPSFEPIPDTRPPTYTANDEHSTLHVTTGRTPREAAVHNPHDLPRQLPRLDQELVYPTIMPITLTHLRVASIACFKPRIPAHEIAVLNRYARDLCPWGESHALLRDIILKLDAAVGRLRLAPAVVRAEQILPNAMAIWEAGFQEEKTERVKQHQDPCKIAVATGWFEWIQHAVKEGYIHVDPEHAGQAGGMGGEGACRCEGSLFKEGWACWDVESSWGGNFWAVR